MLKWHCGRKKVSDPAFSGARIMQGMRLGAVVEVDLQQHASGGFAVLHDDTLDRETTGTGAVASYSADALRGHFLRDNDGKVLSEPLMLLEDLAQLIGTADIASSAQLQLDLKTKAADISARHIDGFVRAVRPISNHVILSASDAVAVNILRQAISGLRTGFDPCLGDLMVALNKTGDYQAFVSDTLAAAPEAEMIYLHYPVVLAADTEGFDMVGAFQTAGKRVDAWTIDRVTDASYEAVGRLLALGVDQITTDDPVGLEAEIAASR